MLIAGIALAGALGALARYLVDVAVIRRDAVGLPVATLAINVTGSFVLGVLTGLVLYHALPATPKAVLGTGFCGAYTTFSTFAYEVVHLVEQRKTREAVSTLALSFVVPALLACSVSRSVVALNVNRARADDKRVAEVILRSDTTDTARDVAGLEQDRERDAVGTACEPVTEASGFVDRFGDAEAGDPPVVETRTNFHRGVGLEREAVGKDRDAVVGIELVGIHDTTHDDRPARRGLNGADDHLPQQELDRVQVLCAFGVIGVELGADPFDRVGDTVERLRDIEIYVGELRGRKLVRASLPVVGGRFRAAQPRGIVDVPIRK